MMTVPKGIDQNKTVAARFWEQARQSASIAPFEPRRNGAGARPSTICGGSWPSQVVNVLKAKLDLVALQAYEAFKPAQEYRFARIAAS